MTRESFVWDRERRELVPKEEYYARKHGPKGTGPMVVRDIEPYKAVAADVATGKKPVIGGRAQHREFLKRNDYVEVGNEWKTPRRSELSQAERIADIKRSMGE